MKSNVFKSKIRTHNLFIEYNKKCRFTSLAYSSDAKLSMPNYVRPATADMRSNQPLRSMTSEEKLNWSKQNKQFRYDMKYIYYEYPCTNHY